MKRIIIHWTAGTNKANATDKRHYHFIVEGDGEIVQGDKLPEANLDTSDGDYAAHTRAANTGAIGVAVAAMHGAKERPFDHGQYPITQKQVEALAALCADLADGYGIPIERHTVLTHAEVQGTLGIRQRNKWDITWLPGMEAPADPVLVGDRLRAMIKAERHGVAGRMQVPVPDEVTKVIDDADKAPGGSTTIWALLASGGASVASAWEEIKSADPMTLVAIAIVAAALIYVFRERIRKAKLGKMAKEALGL